MAPPGTLCGVASCGSLAQAPMHDAEILDQSHPMQLRGVHAAPYFVHILPPVPTHVSWKTDGCTPQPRDITQVGEARANYIQTCNGTWQASTTRLNADGVVTRRNANRYGSAGFTQLSSNEVWYCGQRQSECRCGRCGCCGPLIGCPCNACAQLLIDEGKLQVRRRCSGSRTYYFSHQSN